LQARTLKAAADRDAPASRRDFRNRGIAATGVDVREMLAMDETRHSASPGAGLLLSGEAEVSHE
jgi:hypothetical protein